MLKDGKSQTDTEASPEYTRKPKTFSSKLQRIWHKRAKLEKYIKKSSTKTTAINWTSP